MKLSRQLFLLSLLTLALPWAGCQYLQEMESALRIGQAKALEATSKAVAARLSSDPELVQQLSKRNGQDNSLYAHSLSGAIMVDGYADDWQQQTIKPLSYRNDDFSISLRLGLRRKTPVDFNNRKSELLSQDQLYLFIQVQDSQLQYHHPGRADLINGDHVRLKMGDRWYAVGTSSPGRVKAAYRHQGREIIEHRIRGVWQETPDGYQIELELPLSLSEHGLGVSVINNQPDFSPAQWLGNQHWSLASPPLMQKNPKLNQVLSIFATDGIQLSLANQHHWQIAQSQSKQQQSLQPTPSVLAQWLHLSLLDNQAFPAPNKDLQQGMLTGEEIDFASAGLSTTRWYQQGQRLIARTAVPVATEQQVLAVVLAQQNNDTRITLMNSAFSRLLLYSIACSLVAGVSLLLYASWLSWRIRRLSQAAELAVDEQGRINPQLPASRAKDEIGDLSRSYSLLLERLQGYTEYLQTLASKLSHELRTPLAITKGSLDNLQQEALSPEARIYAQRAEDGCNRLSSILNAMSAANRVESAIRSAESERFQINELFTQVGAAYQATFSQANVQLQCNGQGHVHGSPELLVQLLDKLIDNAVDFCPEQGIISLKLTANDSHFCLSVSNDGPLLPSHMQHQLFDSMVSVRKQGHHDGHLGLGLYIVRLIADYHGAKIKARNRDDGSGVVFSLFIPKTT